MADEHSTQDLSRLAAEAFVYGFPLVFDLQQVDRFIREGMANLPPTPLNRFGHATSLAGPEHRFVSINNDTVYSIASVDVSAGPVRLDVPDTHGRYYVMQFVDAWTNNFAYVGHRGTGTAAASFLLVAAGWSDEVPGDVRVIHVPTAVSTIVGRWAVDGESDMARVRALQDATRLTSGAAGRGLPQADQTVPADLRFFEELRVGMLALPPAERELAYRLRFEPLGLFDEPSPYRDPDPQLAAVLRDGLAAGRRSLEESLSHDTGPEQNGWRLTYHAFDYNLDFFEIGALDDSRWKLADEPSRYVRRAAAARAGLWGNHGYEAAYAMVSVDDRGDPLDGSRSYELRFPAPPPCRAFWSVTMYDTPDYFLVPNAIDRYSIGDRTPGLMTADDGSLTISVQRGEPVQPEPRANWLPAPSGRFRPILRMYEPDDAVFDGGYELPPVRRVA